MMMTMCCLEQNTHMEEPEFDNCVPIKHIHDQVIKFRVIQHDSTQHCFPVQWKTDQLIHTTMDRKPIITANTMGFDVFSKRIIRELEQQPVKLQMMEQNSVIVDFIQVHL